MSSIGHGHRDGTTIVAVLRVPVVRVGQMHERLFNCPIWEEGRRSPCPAASRTSKHSSTMRTRFSTSTSTISGHASATPRVLRVRGPAKMNSNAKRSWTICAFNYTPPRRHALECASGDCDSTEGTITTSGELACAMRPATFS